MLVRAGMVVKGQVGVVVVLIWSGLEGGGGGKISWGDDGLLNTVGPQGV